MVGILGASNGIASCSLASSSKCFSSTNRNSACGSTKRLISQGHATRSTLLSLRVIHFIVTSRSGRTALNQNAGPNDAKGRADQKVSPKTISGSSFPLLVNASDTHALRHSVALVMEQQRRSFPTSPVCERGGVA